MNKNLLQDAHVHLADIKDILVRDAILTQAKEHGVGRMAVNATCEADWGDVGKLAKSSKQVFPFYGIHPWFVNKVSPGWEKELRERVSSNICGIGEIGLDRAKSRPDFEKQKHIFTWQLDLALELKKPVVIHCVDAWGAIMEIFRARPMKNIHFMLHLFSGSIEVLNELLEMGAFISFSHGITDGGPLKVRQAFEATPIDKLLLETDFPDTPGDKGKEHILAYDYFEGLKMLYDRAAHLRGISREELEKRVWTSGSIFMS